MRSQMSLVLSLAAVVAGVVAFFYLAEYEARGGERAPLFSSLRADPHGTAAFRDLLSESGVTNSMLLEPEYPPGTGGVLIQVLPGGDSASLGQMSPGIGNEPQKKDLVEWVMRGNTLIIMCRCNTSSGWEFGISIHRRIKPELIKKIEDRQREGAAPDTIGGVSVTADWNDKQTLSLREPVDLAGEDGVEITPLATAEQGVIAAELAYGAGRVVMVGDPSPILNGWVDQGDNLEFMLGLVGAGPVYFDEWAHGLGKGGSIIGLIEKFGLVPALLQTLFVLLLYRWSGWGVFDQEEAPEREKVSMVEQIDILGRLYSRTMKPDQVRERVGLELMTRAQSSLGAHWADMDQAIETAPASKRERLEKIVDKARSMLHGGGKAGKRELAEALTMSRGLTKEKTNG
ncbi:MAG: DUF4350 domain-containing protein [Nitrospinota bacterium]|nr:DUF4350 domain-containing protein [Nitrospinota bacterium]